MLMHIRAIKHYWDFEGNILYKPELNIIYVDNSNLDKSKILDIVTTINKYKVKYIRGYMTSLDCITRYIVENKIVLKSKPFFISVGELLLESLRLRIVNELKCNIISQYANEECGILGHSAINGIGSTIYLNNANVITEILKLDKDEPVEQDEIGRIVITDFTNHAMPLIRYDTGDLAAIDKVSSCGDIISIKNLCGRKTDAIYKVNGDFIDMYNSMPSEIFNNSNVKQWQFIQNTNDSYTLRLSVINSDMNNLEVRFVTLLKNILGENAKINIEYTDEIPILNSGKRKVIFSNYKK